MNIPRSLTLASAVLVLSSCAGSGGAIDPQTSAWWATTGALSGDDMEGRDTGTPGYDRAAAYVADRFQRAGLRPAGDGDTYFQRIDFDEVEVTGEGTSFSVQPAAGDARPLRFLHEISVAPTWGMVDHLDAPLVFRGYCAPSDMTEVRGAVVACFGTRRTGQTLAAAQLEAATAAGAVAVVRVDDPGFTIEPPRWPLAYARAVVFADGSPKPQSIPALRLSAPAFTDIADASGKDGAGILARGARGEPMAAFDFGARFEARFATRERKSTSANVLAMLPGTDPALADEPVLLIAHLDGYGYGTPVDGDSLYNGALDDAAYVATLIAYADERGGRGLRRPIVFAAVTGEEKGLLGSRWLAAHPTTGAPTPVAVLNLDQLRPLYPLKILTTLGLDDSTLGQTVREVAGPMGIAVRADGEPERNLLKRSDHWPFMQIGVPSLSFLFGFDATDKKAAAAYRDWYERRYHAPQDDLSTPIDHQAQADFHRFWFALAQAVANADTRPQWLPGSPYAPKERVLVFSKTAGWRHDSIPTEVATLQRLAAEAGLVADHSEDGGDFTAANLARYRVVVFASTTLDVLDPAQQRALEGFVQQGGGFVGVHAAADTEYDWPWYGQLVGAWFKSHPPGLQATQVQPERDGQPVGKPWPVRDELYNYRSNPRGQVQVVATIDERTYEGGTMGADHPVTWCHAVAGGRSWYTGLGHDAALYADPEFLASLRRGLRYAAGLSGDC